MKNHLISEAVVSFENIVWSVYQDMGWRTNFLHMTANYRLKGCTAFLIKVKHKFVNNSCSN